MPRTRSSARHLTRFVSPRRSDGHDLLLLFLNGCVDVLDILVGQLLDLFFHGLLGILGQLTPIDDGSTIRLNFPAPTEERRKQLAKEVSKLGVGAP